MTLAWSRHAYAEVVTDQKVATWLGCHRRAFEWFNGVPARLTIDNPKCAITYAIGDDIVATVTFDRTLQLDTANGSPALVLTIGNGTGDATCALATETKKLECTYTVVGDDEDTDGVSIGANPLALNGGRIHGIHGATGGDAELAHAALGSNDRHKVDGVRPTPANASVNGIALTLEWSETLDTGSAPAAGQFVLGVDSGTAPTVSSLTMSGTTMALTLASAADATRDYTLAYTVPSSNPVKDLAGNEAVAFTGTGIETVQITWSFTLTSSRTDGAGNPLVVEGGATATATVSITNAVTTTVAQTVKLPWDGSDIGGGGEPGRLLTIAGVVGPTITVPAGQASASAVIRVREDAFYAPTHTAAFTATHLGTQIGSVDLTLTDDDAPPVMTIAVSASSAASDTRRSAITINEGEGFHLEITLDRGFATFQPPLGSAVTVTAPSGTFNAGDLASMPPSFARGIETFGTAIHSTDNTTAAGAVDAVFAVAPGGDGRYTAGTPASATVRIRVVGGLVVRRAAVLRCHGESSPGLCRRSAGERESHEGSKHSGPASGRFARIQGVASRTISGSPHAAKRPWFKGSSVTPRLSGGAQGRSPWPTSDGQNSCACWSICLTPLRSPHGILTPMHPSRRSVSDEVHGLRANGSLVAGDFDDALAELERTSIRYLLGFLLRCSLVAPTVAMRLAFRLTCRRLMDCSRYGHVVVDECHHGAASSFEQVLSEVRARYVTGLTATPKRRDGQHPIFEMQLGPARYMVDRRLSLATSPFARRLVVRETEFELTGETDLPIQRIYRTLAGDERRNDLILNDVIGALDAGRSPLVLTERKDHLDFLAGRLRAFTRHLIVLQGGVGAKKRREALAALAAIAWRTPRKSVDGTMRSNRGVIP